MPFVTCTGLAASQTAQDAATAAALAASQATQNAAITAAGAQTLALAGNSLSISGGNSITLPATTQDPYATPAQTIAGTATALIVNPADLYARENMPAQTGLANNPATIPAPTASQSVWGVNLLGETLHYAPGLGWRVVAKRFSVGKNYGTDTTPSGGLIVRDTHTATRDGTIFVSMHAHGLSAFATTSVVAALVRKVGDLNSVHHSSVGPGYLGAGLPATTSRTFKVLAGEQIEFLTYHEDTTAGLFDMHSSLSYVD